MIYDFVILVVLIVFIIGGVRRGAAKTLLSVLALIAAGVLSVLLSRFFSQFIFDTFIRNSFEGKITEVLANSVMSSVAQTASEISAVIPAIILSAMGFFGLPQTTFESFCVQEVTEKGEIAAQTITDAIEPAVTGVISTVLCLILFIVLSVLISKLAKIIAKVFRLPLIRVIDSFIGGGLGFVEGLVTVTLILMLFNLLLPLFPAQWTFLSQEYIDTSYVFRFINNGSIIKFTQQFTYSVNEFI